MDCKGNFEGLRIGISSKGKASFFADLAAINLHLTVTHNDCANTKIIIDKLILAVDFMSRRQKRSNLSPVDIIFQFVGEAKEYALTLKISLDNFKAAHKELSKSAILLPEIHLDEAEALLTAAPGRLEQYLQLSKAHKKIMAERTANGMVGLLPYFDMVAEQILGALQRCDQTARDLLPTATEDQCLAVANYLEATQSIVGMITEVREHLNTSAKLGLADIIKRKGR